MADSFVEHGVDIRDLVPGFADFLDARFGEVKLGKVSCVQREGMGVEGLRDGHQAGVFADDIHLGDLEFYLNVGHQGIPYPVVLQYEGRVQPDKNVNMRQKAGVQPIRVMGRCIYPIEVVSDNVVLRVEGEKGRVDSIKAGGEIIPFP